jgi:hypothetical protein
MGAGIVGNIFGARAASRAAREASDLEYEQYMRAAAERRAAVNEVNPRIAEAYSRGQEMITGTAWPQADILQQRGERGGAEAVGAAREANTLLDPYTRAGAEAVRSMSEMAGPAKKFTMEDLQLDPSYQFRLDQGQQALERSRAARGVLAGGGTAKALTRYAQGAASTEYAAAFDRFMRQQEMRQKSLSELTGYGSRAAERAGMNLTGAAEFAGELGTRATGLATGMRVQGARDVAGMGTESAVMQGRNVLGAETAATQDRIDAAHARATGRVAQGNVRSNMWAQLGNTVGSGLDWAQMTQPWKRRPAGAGYRDDLGAQEEYAWRQS